MKTLDGNNRTFTVQVDNNIINDFYNELDPTTVTFLVNMSYQIELGNFDSGFDFLDIAGTFNGWDGTDYRLVAIENNVYTITITDIEAEDEIEFKFRINGSWDKAEFPDGGANRNYIVEQGENSIEYWFNDEDGN